MLKNKLKLSKYVCTASFILQFFLVRYVVFGDVLPKLLVDAIMLVLAIIQIASFEGGMYSLIKDYEDKVGSLDESIVKRVFKTSLVFVIVLIGGVTIICSKAFMGFTTLAVYIPIFIVSLFFYLSSVLDLATKHVEEYK